MAYEQVEVSAGQPDATHHDALQLHVRLPEEVRNPGARRGREDQRRNCETDDPHLQCLE